jgi:hypothetical protein
MGNAGQPGFYAAPPNSRADAGAASTARRRRSGNVCSFISGLRERGRFRAAECGFVVRDPWATKPQHVCAQAAGPDRDLAEALAAGRGTRTPDTQIIIGA